MDQSSGNNQNDGQHHATTNGQQQIQVVPMNPMISSPILIQSMPQQLQTIQQTAQTQPMSQLLQGSILYSPSFAKNQCRKSENEVNARPSVFVRFSLRVSCVKCAN